MIKPILKYPGSKTTIAPWIISHFPAHVHYIEPYVGSSAVFLSKPPSVHEVLNDLNGDIVNLFRVIRTDGQALAQLIEMTPWSEEEFLESERMHSGTGDAIEDARRFLIRCWQAHGVRLAWNSGWKHNGLKGRVYPVRLWQQLPERILASIERFREAEIRNRPALEIIAYYDDPECLLYVDPPYPISSRTGKDRLYLHEMTDSDHVELLELLNRHTGMIVLSGYDHALYSKELAHWQRIEKRAITEHGHSRTEVLWLNEKAACHRQLSLFEKQAM